MLTLEDLEMHKKDSRRSEPPLLKIKLILQFQKTFTTAVPRIDKVTFSDCYNVLG